MSDDLRLIKNVLNGDFASFSSIITRFEEPIYKFAYSMIKNNEAAKEITKEVFITAYNKLYTFKEKVKFSNWLFQIARDKCLKYMRKNKKNIKLNFDMVLASNIQETKESITVFNEFVETLEGIEKEILLLKCIRNSIGLRDISEILGLKDDDAKTKYYMLWDRYNVFLKNQEERCSI